jgi:hypothetical protein
VPPTISPSAPVIVVPTYAWPYYGGAIGAGALYYDPFYWDSYYGNSFSPWFGPAFFSSGGGAESEAATYGTDPFATGGLSGGLRLTVEPKHADVLVDGHYAGVVDDFNGAFQHVNLRPGPHRIEVRAPGYETLAFDVIIQPRHTTTYRSALVRSP